MSELPRSFLPLVYVCVARQQGHLEEEQWLSVHSQTRTRGIFLIYQVSPTTVY